MVIRLFDFNENKVIILPCSLPCFESEGEYNILALCSLSTVGFKVPTTATLRKMS